MSRMSCFPLSFFRTEYRRFPRLKLCVCRKGSRIWMMRMQSFTTLWFAVAVSAMMGTFGHRLRRFFSSR